MTVGQNRVLRVAAWVAAVVGAVLLVLTFVLSPAGVTGATLGWWGHVRLFPVRVEYFLLHYALYPVPAVVVVALQAGALVAFGLVYACVEGKRRSRRIVATVALALLPLALAGVAWLWWWNCDC